MWWLDIIFVLSFTLAYVTRDFVSFQLVNKNAKLQGMLLLFGIQKFKESITAVEDLEAGFTEDFQEFSRIVADTAEFFLSIHAFFFVNPLMISCTSESS